MGIVRVACMAARTPVVPAGHDDIHLETDEVGRQRRRRRRPPARAGGTREVMFWPSTQPQLEQRLAEPASHWWRRGARGPPGIQPIRYTFPACCAAAASGVARRARVRIMMRLIVLRHMVISCRPLLACHALETCNGSAHLLRYRCVLFSFEAEHEVDRMSQYGARQILPIMILPHSV